MVSLVKKKKQGKIYLYLEHRIRIKGKSKRLFQIYLGPEKRIIEHARDFNLNFDYSFSTSDFGLPLALMQVAQRMDLIGIINRATKKRQQGLSVGEYFLIATLNRCVQPSSKSQLPNWFKSSYIRHCFPNHEYYLDANAYYYHYPYLTEEALETIESEIFQKLQEEFDIDISQILYDPTNFSSYINPKHQELPRHGKAKDGRATLNLIGLSLFCTKVDAIPILHKIYPGNIQDAELFKSEFPRFLQILQKRGVKTQDITMVFDKGNISDQLFEAIDASGIKWLCSVRPSSHKNLASLVPSDFAMAVLPSMKLVGSYETQHSFHGAKRRLLVSYSPNQQTWKAKNFRAKLESRVDLVRSFFGERLNLKKWRDASKVDEKVRKEVSKKYLDFVNYSIDGEYGELKFKITIKEDQVKHHIASLGKNFFSTNLESKASDVLWIYRQQFTIERSFSYLKNRNTGYQLKAQPIYSRNDDSIQGHLFTCVLGLLLVMLVKREVNKAFAGISVEKLLHLLSEIKIVEMSMKGSSIVKKQLVEMSEEAQQLCEYLKLKDMI